MHAVPLTPLSRMASPILSAGMPEYATSPSAGSFGFRRTASVNDFQVEKSRHRRSNSQDRAGYDEEAVYRESIARLLIAKAIPFSISGRMPVEANELILFFRTKVSADNFVISPSSSLLLSIVDRAESHMHWTSRLIWIMRRHQHWKL